MLDDDSSTATLTVVDKSHRLYKDCIGSFAEHTPEKDVRKYLATQVVPNESDIADVSLLKPKARNNPESVSFCISVGSAAANEAVYNQTKWPSGVTVISGNTSRLSSAVHYVIWRDFFAQIEIGVEIANLGVE